MSKGLPEVDMIMADLSSHIKDGADPKSNRQHYNYVYEALWKLVEERDRLRKCVHANQIGENYKDGI